MRFDLRRSTGAWCPVSEIACMLLWRQDTGSLRFHSDIAKADPNFSRSFDELMIRFDKSETLDRIGNRCVKNPIILIAYHRAEFTFINKLHGLDAEAYAEKTIEGRRRSSSLKMAENTTSRFLPRTFHHLARHDLSDATQSMLPVSVFSKILFPILGFGAFRHNDHRALISLGITFPHRFGYVIPCEGNFGKQNDVSASGDAAEQHHPPGMPAHHLKDHHALMAHGRRMQTIERIGNAAHRRIKAKCHRSCLEIVVDGFRNPDNRNASFMKLESSA